MLNPEQVRDEELVAEARSSAANKRTLRHDEETARLLDALASRLERFDRARLEWDDTQRFFELEVIPRIEGEKAAAEARLAEVERERDEIGSELADEQEAGRAVRRRAEAAEADWKAAEAALAVLREALAGFERATEPDIGRTRRGTLERDRHFPVDRDGNQLWRFTGSALALGAAVEQNNTDDTPPTPDETRIGCHHGGTLHPWEPGEACPPDGPTPPTPEVD